MVPQQFHTPDRSILLMGVVCAAGAGLMNLDQAANLVNFGACLGFIAVNLSALVHGFWAARTKGPLAMARHALTPVLGLGVCAFIWLSASAAAMILGFVWLALGTLYLAFLSRAAPTPRPPSAPATE